MAAREFYPDKCVGWLGKLPGVLFDVWPSINLACVLLNACVAALAYYTNISTILRRENRQRFLPVLLFQAGGAVLVVCAWALERWIAYWWALPEVLGWALLLGAILYKQWTVLKFLVPMPRLVRGARCVQWSTPVATQRHTRRSWASFLFLVAATAALAFMLPTLLDARGAAFLTSDVLILMLAVAHVVLSGALLRISARIPFTLSCSPALSLVASLVELLYAAVRCTLHGARTAPAATEILCGCACHAAFFLSITLQSVKNASFALCGRRARARLPRLGDAKSTDCSECTPVQSSSRTRAALNRTLTRVGVPAGAPAGTSRADLIAPAEVPPMPVTLASPRATAPP